MYIHKVIDKPYCFIINRYIIQFYTKEKHIRNTPYTFFGITDVLSKMENLINLHESKFLIGMFDLQVWQMIKAKFIKYHYHKRNKTLRYMYKEMIKKEFGKYPSEARIQKFLNILTNNNDKLGVKYTNEKIVEAMKQV